MPAMIVCPEPLAAKAGLEVLRAGGNAVDAAVAAAFTQGVTNPPLCGIGGGGCMNYFDAATGKNTIIHFMAPAGSKALPTVWESIYVGRRDNVGRYEVKGYLNQMGYQSICVPTFIRGLAEAHQRFGSMPWKDLLQASIGYARDGFEVYPYVYRFWAKGKTSVVPEEDPVTKIKLTEACARIYLRNGSTYEVGEWLVQADQAKVLERVANEGAEVFYSGDIGRRIGADIEKNGGFVTYEDMKNYQPLVYDEPTRGTYKGMTVTTDYPPASGVQYLTMFQMLDRLNLALYSHNSVEYIDLVGRVLHQGFEDRKRYYADPNFVDVPLDMLVSRQHADKLLEQVLAGVPASSRNDGYGGTTHMSIVDAKGNAVSLTHSTGSGSGVVTEGLGFIYNNMMGPFNPLPGHHDSVAPGKRAVAGCGPLIVLKNGRVKLVIGSPAGSRKTSGVTQSMLNVFEKGMGMQAAVSAPRFHTEEPGVMYLEPAFSEEVAQGLAAKGYKIERTSYGGRVQAVLVRDDGTLEAGADPRGGGGMGSVP